MKTKDLIVLCIANRNALLTLDYKGPFSGRYRRNTFTGSHCNYENYDPLNLLLKFTSIYADLADG